LPDIHYLLNFMLNSNDVLSRKLIYLKWKKNVSVNKIRIIENCYFKEIFKKGKMIILWIEFIVQILNVF
jgi:hypothetical protein